MSADDELRKGSGPGGGDGGNGPSLPPDAHLDAYLVRLRATAPAGTAYTAARILANLRRILHQTRPGLCPSAATADDLDAYRGALASSRGSVRGGGLGRATQATHLATSLGFYRYLRRKGLTLVDADRILDLPRLPRRVVRADPLDQQEAQALLTVAAQAVEQEKVGTARWAEAFRDLTMVALAVATGRRRSGLCALAVADLDVGRRELRVEREKGAIGRVLPVADWAVAIADAYRAQARPVLLAGRPEVAALFPSRWTAAVAPVTFCQRLRALFDATIAANPDLADGLRRKRLSSHSLRVTCATLLFRHGCPIRSVHEILLHRRLSTTAAYTPLTVEDIRRALIHAHPRA